LFNQSDRFLFEFCCIDFSILHRNLHFRMELLNYSSGFLGEDQIRCLQEHLPIEVAGTKASTEMVLEVLVHAATKGQSIEASCAELVGSADSNHYNRS
jgi:hypothetical protein